MKRVHKIWAWCVLRWQGRDLKRALAQNRDAADALDAAVKEVLKQ